MQRYLLENEGWIKSSMSALPCLRLQRATNTQREDHVLDAWSASAFLTQSSLSPNVTLSTDHNSLPVWLLVVVTDLRRLASVMDVYWNCSEFWASNQRHSVLFHLLEYHYSALLRLTPQRQQYDPTAVSESVSSFCGKVSSRSYACAFLVYTRKAWRNNSATSSWDNDQRSTAWENDKERFVEEEISVQKATFLEIKRAFRQSIGPE